MRSSSLNSENDVGSCRARHERGSLSPFTLACCRSPCAREHLQKPDHGVQRCSDFRGDTSDKARLAPVRLLGDALASTAACPAFSADSTARRAEKSRVVFAKPSRVHGRPSEPRRDTGPERRPVVADALLRPYIRPLSVAKSQSAMITGRVVALLSSRSQSSG